MITAEEMEQRDQSRRRRHAATPHHFLVTVAATVTHSETGDEAGVEIIARCHYTPADNGGWEYPSGDAEVEVTQIHAVTAGGLIDLGDQEPFGRWAADAAAEYVRELRQ